jgi:hypothetical protein
METRFQHDFSRVRVYTDDAARKSARAQNALAYTAGNRIVFGREALALDSAGSQRLLAHELAHVVQQANGVAEGIQRKPLAWPRGRTNYRFDTAQITADDLDDPEIVERLHAMSRPELRAYRARVADPVVQGLISSLMVAPPLERVATDFATIDKAEVEAMAGYGYWQPRTSSAYAVTLYTDRLDANAEERDAVYAAVWGVWPSGPPSAAAEQYVTIPPNAQRKNALLYQFSVGPPAPAGTKPSLDIRFVLARPGAIPQPAAEPPRGYIAPQLEISTAIGFPGDPDQWLREHREEKRQIAYWLKQQNADFDGVLLTRSIPENGKGPPRETTFRLKGTKQKGVAIADLHIELLLDRRPATVTPPDDYRVRDYADILIHEAQTKPHATLGDKLGYVDLRGVPAGEVLSAKYAVVRYWRDVNTRNAEVDAILPIAGSDKRVYYTLRFRSDNEVDVERVGQEGSSAKLDPARLDVARVHGYDTNSAEPAKLKTWLGTRYPGVKSEGATVEELRTSANNAMNAGVGAAAWYETNYKILVLGATAAKSRLKSVHKLKEPEVPDAEMKTFTPQELKLAELSLQTLTDRILATMRFLRLGRQVVSRQADGTERKTTAGGKVGAITYTTGTARMIVAYDDGINDAGGTLAGVHGAPEGVHDPHVLLLTHELGHSIESKLGARVAFNKFVERENIQPFTRYAGEDPEKEFFPEAFALYQTDPEWLRRNHWSVYEWLDTLNKTGKVPK